MSRTREHVSFSLNWDQPVAKQSMNIGVLGILKWLGSFFVLGFAAATVVNRPKRLLKISSVFNITCVGIQMPSRTYAWA